MNTYLRCFRVLDHQGVLHLARASDPLGKAFCGWPPQGTTWSDPVGEVYGPGTYNPQYQRICSGCNEIAFDNLPQDDVD